MVIDDHPACLSVFCFLLILRIVSSSYEELSLIEKPEGTNSRPRILPRNSLDRYLPVTRCLSRKPRFSTVCEREKRVNGGEEEAELAVAAIVGRRTRLDEREKQGPDGGRNGISRRRGGMRASRERTARV